MNNKILEFPLKKPLASILLFISLSGVLSLGLLSLEADFSAQFWFKNDQLELKYYSYFKKNYSLEEEVVIGLDSPTSWIESTSWNKLAKFCGKLLKIKNVARLNCATSFPVLIDEKDSLEIREISLFELDKREEEFNKNGQFRKLFFSQDKRTNIIRIVISNKKEVRLLKDLINSEFKSLFDKKYKIHFLGFPILESNFTYYSFSDLKIVLPIMTFVMFILLFGIFKNLHVAIIPFIVFGIGCLATFGFAGIFGLKFHNTSTVIPGVLLTITLADIIHFYSQFRREQKFEPLESALINAAKAIYKPTLITSITTAVGFLSFLFTDVTPIVYVGLTSAFGTMLIWFLTIFVVIPYTKLNINKFKMKEMQELKFASLKKIENFKISIIAITTIVTIISVIGISKINFNTNPFEYFSEKTNFRSSYDHINSRLGFTQGPTIFIKTNNSLRKSQFIKKIKNFEKKMINENLVYTVDNQFSLYNPLEEAFRKKDSIVTDEKVSDIYTFLSLFVDSQINIFNYLSLDEKFLKWRVYWDKNDSSSFLIGVEKIKSLASEFDLEIILTGDMLLYHKMIDFIVPVLIKSIFIALACVFVLFLILFKNLKIALLSLIPNLIPILFILGLSSLLNISIDLTMAMSASVIFGLAVDDTIHFIHFYLHRNNGLSSKYEKISNTLNSIGHSLATTTLVLVFGFLVFNFSLFIPNARFGSFCALAFLVALALDIYLLPLILLKLRDNEF